MKKRSVLYVILIVAILSATFVTTALADGKTRYERICDIGMQGQGIWDDETQTCTSTGLYAFAFCGPDMALVWFAFPRTNPGTIWTVSGSLFCVPDEGSGVTAGAELDIWKGNCGAHIQLAPSGGTAYILHNYPWWTNIFGPVRPPSYVYKGYCSVFYQDSAGTILSNIGDVSSVYWNLDASSRYYIDNGTLDIIILVDGVWQSCGATVYEDVGDFGRAVCRTSARTFALGRP